MKLYNRMIALANKLADNELKAEAEDIIAQVLELNDMSNLTVVTPDHPLYPVLVKVLRPGQAIEDKLADFSNRLALR